MPTIAHISDLHLQSGVPERQAQVEPILEEINAMKPDLVVISGDVTDDGWDSIEELKWAKDWLEERIDGEWFAVPGNHDVGNFVSLPTGQITQDRIEAWNQTFGSSPFRLKEGWLIQGRNNMVTGSSLKDSHREAKDKLREAAKKARYVVEFFHAPPFVEKPVEASDPAIEYWTGPSFKNRVECEELFIANESIDYFRLMASGHVHQTRLFTYRQTVFAWAPPASGTWVHAPGLPNPPMPEQTGFFLHHLHDDGRVESELIECAPMLKLYEHNPGP